MTTRTLQEADRYLLNNGFTCKPLPELDRGYQAGYELGQMKGKGAGIIIRLHDDGDGRWTDTLVACSEDLKEKARQIQEALQRLPGFEPHRI